MVLLLALLLLTALCCTSAFAANGDVASAVEETWKEAAKQIKKAEKLSAYEKIIDHLFSESDLIR